MLLSASNWHCFSAAGRTSHQHHHHHLETRIEPCRAVAQFVGVARPFFERIFEFALFNFALDRWGKYQRRFCAKINKSALTSPFTFWAASCFIRALAVACVSCAASAAPQFNQILLFDFASLRVFLFPATWLAVRISFKCLAFSLIWFSRLPLLPPLLLLSVTQQFSVAYINGYSAIRFQAKRFSPLHFQFLLLSKLKFIK